jgi:iron donor protein CyaY
MSRSDFLDDVSFRKLAGFRLEELLLQLDEVDFEEFEPRHIAGTLNIQFDDGSVVMLSLQTPTHELWLSANYTAWHFLCVNGTWIERDTSESMLDVLNTILSEKMKLRVQLV